MFQSLFAPLPTPTFDFILSINGRHPRSPKLVREKGETHKVREANTGPDYRDLKEKSESQNASKITSKHEPVSVAVILETWTSDVLSKP